MPLASLLAPRTLSVRIEYDHPIHSAMTVAGILG